MKAPQVWADGMLVCKIPGLAGFDYDNARLIAAAPELLEALKSALQTAEFERHPHRGWQDEARRAIAKAEGDSNGEL
jgi:hypothetical protein